MTNATIAVDRLEALQVALQIPTQIAFDQELVARDRMNDVVQLLRRQFLRPQIRIDGSLLEDPLRGRRSDAVNVRQ